MYPLTLSCINLSSIPQFVDMMNNDNDSNNSNILKLNKVYCNNKKYTVITYDKKNLTSDLINSYGLCRSVILNSNNEVVSFAPPKSILLDDFISKYGEVKENIRAEEFIEGTMINVFWDSTIGENGYWEISTRNTVGAASSFYKNTNSISFRSMFFEAAHANNLILENLNKSYCYSFVLQHPQNRIVVPFTRPNLYLVAIYHIVNSYMGNPMIYPADILQAKNFDWFGATIKFPEIYNFEKYSDLIEKYASMNTSYDKVGVVLHNVATCERCKIRNPVYEKVRILRGNQPKLEYQYLFLRKEGKVSEYLKFFPEHKKDFSGFRDKVHLFTGTLFSSYISCYIKKEKPLIEFSEQYRTHMFNIHKQYLNELKEKKMVVTNAIVIQYVNNLHPSLLMHSINYEMKNKNMCDINEVTEMVMDMDLS